MKVLIKEKLYIAIPHLMRNVQEIDLSSQEINKGNNKITELRTILQRESQNT